MNKISLKKSILVLSILNILWASFMIFVSPLLGLGGITEKEIFNINIVHISNIFFMIICGGVAWNTNSKKLLTAVSIIVFTYLFLESFPFWGLFIFGSY